MSWTERFLWKSTRWYSSEMGVKWNLSSLWLQVSRPYARVFWWLVKSFQYSIFLWKDFDWDYCFFLMLMQYKLKRMKRQILANNIILRSEEVGSQIQHAEDLIEKYLTDDFCTAEQEAHEKKWGETKDLSRSIIDTNGNKLYEWDMCREKATTEALKAQEKQEQRELYDKSEQEKEQCLTDLFNHIRLHIKEWWD